MKQTGHSSRQIASLSVRLTAAAAAFLVSGVISAGPALAAYEQVGNFSGTPGLSTVPIDEVGAPDPFSEEVQLGGVSGMAINVGGAGGVAPGTLYAVGEANTMVGGVGLHIAKFNPDGQFRLMWTVEGKRCGPETAPAFVACHSQLGGSSRTDVAVDQATGYVYVMKSGNGGIPLAPALTVFNPDGSKEITQFAPFAKVGETTAATPEKVHQPGGIAVADDGTVYLADYNEYGNYRRVMVFEPQSPGDYEHYVYAGQESDLWASTKFGAPLPLQPRLDNAGALYGHNEEEIFKFELDHPEGPVCTFKFAKSGITAATVNPVNGEVFFFSYQDKKVHQLAPCDEEGKFVEKATIGLSPNRKFLNGMAVNGSLQLEASRPPGVLYGGSPDFEGGLPCKPIEKNLTGLNLCESAIGFIFAPPKELAPSISSESVSAVDPSSASLEAKVNPEGTPSRYSFQYLGDAAYEANEPEERQALTVAASGGVFGLGLEGQRFGGAATVTLSSGSKAATALATATATATLSAATGTGDLNGASGKGTVITGSTTITALSTTVGSFAVGETINGEGIPSNTTITAIKPEGALQELTISAAATKSAAHTTLRTGTTTITSLTTGEGSFVVGQGIAGELIQEGTTITAVKAGELTISKPVEGPQTGVTLKAGSTTLTAVSSGIGSFEVGQRIEGEGIPPVTTITAVKAGELAISKPATKPGTGVAISTPGPYPLAVGEEVEGPGIPAGTTIAALKPGELTLSNPATASGTGVLIHAGLPADATATQVKHALEGLPTIGAGGVEVSGGPGDEAGSSPYEIVFTGALENTDVPLLQADGSALSGGAATATVEGEHDGGGGFAKGAAEVPVGGGLLEGSAPLQVADAISGLSSDTTYHYRAIATSHCSPSDEAKVCLGTGATKSFHTFAAKSPGLPDNRAYELVSPPEKHGGQVIPAEPTISSCRHECKPGSTFTLFPMQSSPTGDAFVYEGTPFSFTEGALNENEYLSRRSPQGWQTTNLTPRLLTSKGTGTGGYRAFDTDLTRGVLEQRNRALLPEAPEGYSDLYRQPTNDPLALAPLLTEAPPNRLPGSGGLNLLYAGASPDLERIFFSANDALTEDSQGGPEAKLNLYEWSAGQLHSVNVAPGEAETIPGAAFGDGGSRNDYAISADGSRLFWSAKETGQLYVRIDGKETRAIEAPGKFLAASADGSEVLLDDGCLYELASEECEDLTQGEGGFLGIAGRSEDLSHIYFVDTAVLDEAENEHGAGAREGEANLYAWDAASEATTFIATLLAGGSDAWSEGPQTRSAEASPAGRWLAFTSHVPLTGFDNTGPCVHAGGETRITPCQEVFLYDSSTDELSCPSCGQSGAPPLGSSRLHLYGGPGRQARYLLDSGRLYFDSEDSLSPFDTNKGVEDVYQYEPKGVGSCARQGGCTSLISAGRSGIDSNFLGIDANGRNVFFTSRDQLVPQDKDELIDLYVAREGGGIPAPGETGECQGEACLPSLPPPASPTPGSSSFQGPGNVVEKKQKKRHKHKKRHKQKRAHKQKQARHNRGGAK